ncbi:MAG: type I DNA topoisomerase [Anaerovoracaceae bacterium]|nr:type I DNA topoisomerase [Anaerovoracaceae bacterium]
MSEAKKTLVIVESPAKAKTIEKYLGSKYRVIASVGHIRDLPKSKLGIRVDDDFEPEYINIRGKGDLIKSLKKEAKAAGKILLATDPDREGEAISWHLAFLLGIDEDEPCRVVFNEITKNSVKEAIKNPRPIDLKLVDAQQARRVLDRLVGYKISPLLWRKVRRGLSAGRVQSAALKIICDREKIIRDFVPVEYWTIEAKLEKEGETLKSNQFVAKLTEDQAGKITVNNKEEADKILDSLKAGDFKVDTVEKKERIKKPYPPFTTSSLQQAASSRLNFYTKKTMMIAQQLYEGRPVKGQGTIGLVTYIRTDSVRISPEAKATARTYIEDTFSPKYWADNFYTNKKKDVQDAHEAIRPSRIDLSPEDIKDSLTKDQYNLYKLIWNRYVASQMPPAVFDAVGSNIVNSGYTFRATGSTLKFDGFLKVYSDNKEEDKDKALPELVEGETLNLLDLGGTQSFTQPPFRFTEASLVKDLEDKNIGRPSTYAPIIGTLLERKYISREKKTLFPTDLGFIVTEMMEEYFKEIVDANFTAGMEDKLDEIEIKDADWKEIVKEFYATLKVELEIADAKIEKIEFEEVPTGENCELCGKPMVIKQGRFGNFAACTGYPECKNTKPILKTIGVSCPSCGKDIVARKGKSGRVFYGCSGYPDCTQSYWSKPIDRKCPLCQSLLVEKKTKTSDIECSNKECGYKE